ncbi:hypothetical protein EDB19DRAFT_1781080, partial [Suillus lakei]
MPSVLWSRLNLTLMCVLYTLNVVAPPASWILFFQSFPAQVQPDDCDGFHYHGAWASKKLFYFESEFDIALHDPLV